MPEVAPLSNSGDSLTRAAGKAIRAHRAKMGLSGADFAKQMGVSERTQRSYEAGQRPPDLNYLHAAVRHGLDMGALLPGLTDSALDLTSAAMRAGVAAGAVAAAIQARGVICPPETVGRIVQILCLHHWDSLANPPVSAPLVDSLVAMATE